MTGVNKKIFWQWGMVFLAMFFVFNLNFSFDSRIGVGSDNFSNLNIVSAQEGDTTNVDSWTDTREESPREIVGDNWFTIAIKALLVGVLKVMSWLLTIATVIFAFVIEPKNVAFIMENEGIYASWAMVRDFLNLGFILVLLYIAFCVIFQIGSYSDSWKKMLMMMVIMALLVNFSFPICRFVVDVSNITFYYLVNTGFPDGKGDAIFTSITNDAGLGKILNGASENFSIEYLIASIIFTFILAITLLVIAALFVVRIVAIGMLIIFSPIGIAGAAFPFSKKYASEWWDSLFKYSFFAPIMMFMILIATKIMEHAKSSSIRDITGRNLGAGQDPGFLGTAAFFSIPVIILWYGMGMAQKFSIAGATEVTGMAKKASNWAKKLPMRGGKAFWKTTGVPGATKAGWDNFTKTGKMFGKKLPGYGGSDALEAREASMAGFIKGGVKGRDAARKGLIEKRNKEDINKESEKGEYEAMRIADLTKEMDTLAARIENDRRNGKSVDRKDIIKLAGMQKHARGRGKEYEQHREDEIESRGGFTPDTSGYDKVAHEAKLAAGAPGPGSSAADIAKWQAEMEVHKEQKKLHDEWKKNKTEYYQKEKGKRLDAERQDMKAAYSAT